MDVKYITKQEFAKCEGIISYDSAQTDYGLVLYAMFDNRICALGFGFDRQGNSLDEQTLLSHMQHNASQIFNAGKQVRKSPTMMRDINQDIQQFFTNKGAQIPPLLLVGTEYQHRGWQSMAEIPFGKCDISYGALAEKFNSHSRAVGTHIVARNPIALFLPCHRIIHKNASSNRAKTQYAYGAVCKIALQKAEQLQ
ncbi:MAG: methylated-DNA--[protein]-cysteine S-methyltransferase [Alphaproteobacteria bacterium]|nr:methylated-DNA--[protein]-cysteine S-methyltransferase [Alphaproteobacteria bacterium]